MIPSITARRDHAEPHSVQRYDNATAYLDPASRTAHG
jgi:hypothetical protein